MVHFLPSVSVFDFFRCLFSRHFQKTQTEKGNRGVITRTRIHNSSSTYSYTQFSHGVHNLSREEHVADGQMEQETRNRASSGRGRFPQAAYPTETSTSTIGISTHNYHKGRSAKCGGSHWTIQESSQAAPEANAAGISPTAVVKYCHAFGQFQSLLISSKFSLFIAHTIHHDMWR